MSGRGARDCSRRHIAPSPAAHTAQAASVLGAGAARAVADVEIIASRSGPLAAADLQAVGRVASLARGVKRIRSVRELGVSADREAAVIRARVQLSNNDISKDEAIVN